MQLLYANNAKSTLAGAISNTSVSANLQVGTGALFPQPTPGQYFKLTFNDASTGFRVEVVHVTAMAGDTIAAMTRGMEGTAAQNWSAGDLASNFFTAGAISALVQMPSNAGNPNGVVPGNAATATTAASTVWDSVNSLTWVCTVTGNAAGAVWVAPDLLYSQATPVGAGVNKFRNATCQIAQRGANVTVMAGSTAYTLDGYLVGSSGASVTTSQSASIGLAPNSMTMTGQTGVTDAFVILPIESIDAFALASQNCIFQVKITNLTGAALAPALTIKTANTTDGWSAATSVVSNAILTSVANNSTTQLSYAFSMPIGARNGVSVRLDFGTALGSPGAAIRLGDWDIRAAATNIFGTSTPVPELRPYFMEFLQCARYLPSLDAAGITSHMYFGPSGLWVNASGGGVVIPFYTRARAPITAVTYSALTDFTVNWRGTLIGLTSLVFDSNNIGPFYAVLDFVGNAGAIATPGEFSNLIAINGNARMYFSGAELNGSAI